MRKTAWKPNSQLLKKLLWRCVSTPGKWSLQAGVEICAFNVLDESCISWSAPPKRKEKKKKSHISFTPEGMKDKECTLKSLMLKEKKEKMGCW